MSTLQPTTTYGAILGATLVKLRNDLGLKQSEVAAAVGVGPSTWSRIENGESSLSTDQLKLVAKVLLIQPSKIIELADEAEAMAAARGIAVKIASKSELEEIVITEGLTVNATAGLVNTVGILPVFGSVIGGIVSNISELVSNKKEKK